MKCLWYCADTILFREQKPRTCLSLKKKRIRLKKWELELEQSHNNKNCRILQCIKERKREGEKFKKKKNILPNSILGLMSTLQKSE